MSNQKPISHFIAGIMLAAIQIIYSLVLNFSGLEQTGAMTWISYCLLVAGLIIFVHLYGNANNNQLSFGNLFAYGFKVTAIAMLIVISFTVIYFVAMPEVKEKMFEAARKEMERQNKMSDEEIDSVMEGIRKYIYVVLIGGILLTYAILGAIGSLIGAGITKRKPHNPLDQLDMK